MALRHVFSIGREDAGRSERRVSVRDSIREAWKRLCGDEVQASGAPAVQRKTVALPSILSPYQTAQRALPKPTPANLRKFAETPLVRRAINLIKDRVASLDWQVRLKRDYTPERVGYAGRKALILRRTLEAPNDSDSFRTLIEQVLEDALVGGFGAIEMDLTGDTERPFELWPVDGATIRINPKWDGKPDSPRYAQATGLAGSEGLIPLNDDELIYLRMNPRTHTPFGLGPLEVAFETVNTFLSAHRFSGKLASNSVVQYALWLNGTSPAQQERLIRWWQDEIEGTGRVPILSTEQKPEVLRFGAGTDADLRLAWQEFLLRIIADAFDLPAQFLGVVSDVNRATAAEMTEMAFRSAIVPTARLVAEYLTRDAIGKKLGWSDLEFVFTDVDASDEMEQAQIDEILLRNGVLTVNEVRRARGLAEIV